MRRTLIKLSLLPLVMLFLTGCASIGVTYGYGTREELVENGADDLADTPEQIRVALGMIDNARQN